MPQFKHIPKGSAIGSGAYVFRHLGAEAPSIPDYLCFTAQEADSTIALAGAGRRPYPTYNQAFEISYDGLTWSEYTTGDEISLANIGDKVYWRGDNITVQDERYGFQFQMTGVIAASGNIMSLLDKSVQSLTISYDECFYGLFGECESLVSAPSLPATVLTANCYGEMFAFCSHLAETPALPATELADSCYDSMFLGCESLTTLPLLTATSLPGRCYACMFQGCDNIKLSETQTGVYQYPYRIPASGTGTLEEESATEYMFNTTGGTFVGTPTVNTTYYTDHEPV